MTISSESRARTKAGLAAILASCAVLATAILGPVGVPRAEAQPAAVASGYHNAVTDSFSDTFADPAVIQGKDGWWYVYATSDPLTSDGPYGLMHVARTKDWISFEYLGEVFDAASRPTWATQRAGLWAPDIRYVNGKYVLYFTVTDTTLNPGDDFAIGAATSDSPAGPWTPSAGPVVGPFLGNDGTSYWNTIDPALFTDTDGSKYLYYGGFYGGIFVTKLSDDGMTAVGEPVRATIDNRYEGSFVVRHGDWYYLMVSAANCCSGPVTGYTVFAGRSRSPMGPFVDKDGIALTEQAPGGTIVVSQNGNRFVGVGHNAMLTDSQGRDFLVYHGIDRNKPWLNVPNGINRRPTLIDPVVWVDGWPVVRAGAGPSDATMTPPVLGTSTAGTFTDPATMLYGGVTRGSDAQAGATAVLDGKAHSRTTWSGDLRMGFDVSGSGPLQVTVGAPGRSGTSVTIEHVPGKSLSVSVTEGKQSRAKAVPLRLGQTWHHLTLQVKDGQAIVSASESNLNDDAAVVSLPMASSLRAAPVSFLAKTGNVSIDNLTLQRPVDTTGTAVAVPQPTEVIWKDDFDGPAIGAQWNWIRQQSNVTVSGGKLNWPVPNGDIVGAANNVGLLLTEAPEGNWIFETKIHLDLGTDLRNYQQAGIIVYANDDDLARLGTVAIWNTRQTEYGREKAVTPEGAVGYGAGMIGTTAPTVWMRIAHSVNAEGEHLYRAGTSRDGVNWTWGAVWTFTKDQHPQMGLYAHGGAYLNNVATFEYAGFWKATVPAVDSGGM